MAKKDLSQKKILADIYNALYKSFGPQHWWPGDTPFEVAIGAILTQNTNWTNVEKAITNLKDNKVLKATVLHKMPLKKLSSFIRPAGYFNVKAKRLKEFLHFLCNDYRGSMERMRKVPPGSMREALLGVKGIGPETADSILLYALEKPVFVIDAYTKRVMSRHGLVHKDVTYHEMQELFHKTFPPDVPLYNEYHALFVMVGKDFCKPKPRCSGCPLETML